MALISQGKSFLLASAVQKLGTGNPDMVEEEIQRWVLFGFI